MAQYAIIMAFIFATVQAVAAGTPGMVCIADIATGIAGVVAVGCIYMFTELQRFATATFLPVLLRGGAPLIALMDVACSRLQSHLTHCTHLWRCFGGSRTGRMIAKIPNCAAILTSVTMQSLSALL